VPLSPVYGALADEGQITYGLEIGFRMKSAKTVPNAIILKSLGASLNDSWRPEGTLYKVLLAQTYEALQQYDAELGGFIWVQGFKDQFEDVYCQPIPQLYQSNLTQLITNLLYR
jgi:hypothetical protein